VSLNKPWNREKNKKEIMIIKCSKMLESTWKILARWNRQKRVKRMPDLQRKSFSWASSIESR